MCKDRYFFTSLARHTQNNLTIALFKALQQHPFPGEDAKRRQAQATKESILLLHRYAFPRSIDHPPKNRDKPPYISRNPLSLQANYQVASKALLRSCTTLDKGIARLFFVCYSIIKQITIEDKTRKDRGKSSAVTRQD